jgi:hypothetical protein
MSDNQSSEDIQARLKKFASGYQPKLPRKFALLLPFKSQIKMLLVKKATYDDIRMILADVKIVVSKDTVHRFCRKVIGQKPVRQRNVGTKKISPFKISSAQPLPENIRATLQEQRERYSGPWSRRKRGPRIADSKNL